MPALNGQSWSSGTTLLDCYCVSQTPKMALSGDLVRVWGAVTFCAESGVCWASAMRNYLQWVLALNSENSNFPSPFVTLTLV